MSWDEFEAAGSSPATTKPKPKLRVVEDDVPSRPPPSTQRRPRHDDDDVKKLKEELAALDERLTSAEARSDELKDALSESKDLIDSLTHALDAISFTPDEIDDILATTGLRKWIRQRPITIETVQLKLNVKIREKMRAR
ncbi:MAG: hypothetical protein M0R66_03940 [Candidatus Omnitrophica bacterium]|nr:hypothetical protein [Candidatus Omnitrophota bacterium]